MPGKTLKVGVISRKAYMNRTHAIATGKHKKKDTDPKIWFESIKSLAQVLSNENQELLKTIIKSHPGSLTELETLTKLKKSNLSLTLKTLAQYGIVDLEKKKGRLVPKVLYTNFKVGFGLDTENQVA